VLAAGERSAQTLDLDDSPGAIVTTRQPQLASLSGAQMSESSDVSPRRGRRPFVRRRTSTRVRAWEDCERKSLAVFCLEAPVDNQDVDVLLEQTSEGRA
jgi:hypothetical protein